jgi:hypothetical protein
MARSAFSTRPTQEAQLMPLMVRRNSCKGGKDGKGGDGEAMLDMVFSVSEA